MSEFSGKKSAPISEYLPGTLLLFTNALQSYLDRTVNYVLFLIIIPRRLNDAFFGICCAFGIAFQKCP